MFDFLIERENEEMLRTSSRTLTFPNNKSHAIEAYRLIWSWYDRLIAAEFGPDETELNTYIWRCHEEEDLPLHEAIGRVVTFFVKDLESYGLDITDHNITNRIAKRQIQKWLKGKKTS